MFNKKAVKSMSKLLKVVRKASNNDQLHQLLLLVVMQDHMNRLSYTSDGIAYLGEVGAVDPDAAAALMRLELEELCELALADFNALDIDPSTAFQLQAVETSQMVWKPL